MPDTYEGHVVTQLRDIAASLRVLSGRQTVSQAMADQDGIRTFTDPQKGVQRFSEPTDEQLQAYGEELRRLTEPSVTPEGEWQEYLKYQRRSGSGQVLSYAAWRSENQAQRLVESTGEISPRLAEKLLNPEGH